MKQMLLFLLVLFSSGYSFAQDLSDEKTVAALKNIKHKSCNANGKHYSIILSDNSYLYIKYNVVTNGEYNATYSFVHMPDNFSFESAKAFNVSHVMKNLNYWCTTIGFSKMEIASLKQLIEQSKSEFAAKKVLLPMGFMKGYDEANLVFGNNENSIVCSFFFRRLL